MTTKWEIEKVIEAVKDSPEDQWTSNQKFAMGSGTRLFYYNDLMHQIIEDMNI
jgi:hypothetical protein